MITWRRLPVCLPPNRRVIAAEAGLRPSWLRMTWVCWIPSNAARIARESCNLHRPRDSGRDVVHGSWHADAPRSSGGAVVGRAWVESENVYLHLPPGVDQPRDVSECPAGEACAQRFDSTFGLPGCARHACKVQAFA